MIKKLLIAIQIVMLCQISSAYAANDDDEYPDVEEPTPSAEPRPVTSMEAFSGMGEQTGNSLGIAADYAIEQGNIDQAIKLCKRALDKDYDDLDTHMTYAKALEAKLKHQKEKDHNLLDECVKEWLIVYRTEVGDEKGISYHGISPLGHFYEDEDRSIPARNHIVKLTGRAPKLWETDTKFMKWVDRPVINVAGQIISKPLASNPSNNASNNSTDDTTDSATKTVKDL